MSSPLALAAVTAVLKDLLNDGLLNNNDLSAVGSFSVSALPPDRITTGATEDNRVNLFLYQVTPNLGWRNALVPSSGFGGERLTNPPLALDLHYLLTAYGQADFNAEILLGYAMEILHNNGLLGRDAIRRSLSPQNPITVSLIPDDGQGRKAIDLADQVEAIKIAPHYLAADELSRLWTAMQARYRPTVAYQVSTVLIQSVRPTRSPLPVLKRGNEDRGVKSQPNLSAPPAARPTLTGIDILPVAGGTHDSAELGDTIELNGWMLGGDRVTALFRHSLLDQAIEQPVDPTPTGQRALVRLPPVDVNGAPESWPDWPIGNYTVALRIERAGKPPLLTNELGLRIAARIFAPPRINGSGSSLALMVRFFPRLRSGQRVDLYVADAPFRPAPIDAPTEILTVPIAGVAASEVPVPVALRIDGVDSEFIRDRAATPPQFDPQQLVSIPQ